MTTHSISSREFTAKVAECKRWAELGPVFITDRGEPAHVLLAMDEYLRLTGGDKTLADLLAFPESNGVEFEIEPVAFGARAVDM